MCRPSSLLMAPVSCAWLPRPTPTYTQKVERFSAEAPAVGTYTPRPGFTPILVLDWETTTATKPTLVADPLEPSSAPPTAEPSPSQHSQQPPWPPFELEIEYPGMSYHLGANEVEISIGMITPEAEAAAVPFFGLRLNTVAHAFRVVSNIKDCQVRAVGYLICPKDREREQMDIGMQQQAWDEWHFDWQVLRL